MVVFIARWKLAMSAAGTLASVAIYLVLLLGGSRVLISVMEESGDAETTGSFLILIGYFLVAVAAPPYLVRYAITGIRPAGK